MRKRYPRVIRYGSGGIALTPANAPTNPAFITFDRFEESLRKGAKFFGFFEDEEIAGCVAIEKSRHDESTYFIERLAVLPAYRHRGIGKLLLDFAFMKVNELGGKEISIGIIDENERLKKWYSRYGFIETGAQKNPGFQFTVCFMKKSVSPIF